jgi:hypothetical protein
VVRGCVRAIGVGLIALTINGCGASAPSSPTPPTPPGNGGGQPPSNNLPVVEAIGIQGSKPNEPANFADVGETVSIVAKVHDDETPVDQLQYAWTATVGTFSGSGPNVSWTAPDAVVADSTTIGGSAVTISLKVTERYGPLGGAPPFEHSVSGTARLSLHDSARSVGEMARRFLLDFSDSSIRDVPYIMRNFSRARCPQPGEVDSEYSDVTKDRIERRRTDYSVASVPATVSFKGTCPFRGKPGDACVVIPVFWADVFLPTNEAGWTRGNDIIAAAYSTDDDRWWLCASDYQGLQTVGAAFYR